MFPLARGRPRGSSSSSSSLAPLPAALPSPPRSWEVIFFNFFLSLGSVMMEGGSISSDVITFVGAGDGSA